MDSNEFWWILMDSDGIFGFCWILGRSGDALDQWMDGWIDGCKVVAI